MSKVLFNLRIEREKLHRLNNIANSNNTCTSTLLRAKIDQLLDGETSEWVKHKAIKLIRELNTPFAYVKTKTGREWAERERQIRKELIDGIKKSFNIKDEEV